jgi:hypothetical protein
MTSRHRASSGGHQESVAAGVGEIDGTNKRYCNQNHQSGKKDQYNHSNLLESGKGGQARRQSYVMCFQQVTMKEVCREVAKNGQVWATVHNSRVLELASAKLFLLDAGVLS